jgi:hypothetical protein
MDMTCQYLQSTVPSKSGTKGGVKTFSCCKMLNLLPDLYSVMISVILPGCALHDLGTTMFYDSSTLAYKACVQHHTMTSLFHRIITNPGLISHQNIAVQAALISTVSSCSKHLLHSCDLAGKNLSRSIASSQEHQTHLAVRMDFDHYVGAFLSQCDFISALHSMIST